MAKDLHRCAPKPPLFFSIFINDLFLFIETTTLCNYADDNNLYPLDKILILWLEGLGMILK